MEVYRYFIIIFFSATLYSSQNLFLREKSENGSTKTSYFSTPATSTALNKKRNNKLKFFHNTSENLSLNIHTSATSYFQTLNVAMDKNYFPEKPDFKDFSRKKDYDSGILKDIEPDVKEVIRRELDLTDWQMQNLVFLVDTSDNASSARASVTEGVILFHKNTYAFARQGLDLEDITLSCNATALNGKIYQKIPPPTCFTHIFRYL